MRDLRGFLFAAETAQDFECETDRMAGGTPGDDASRTHGGFRGEDAAFRDQSVLEAVETGERPPLPAVQLAEYQAEIDARKAQIEDAFKTLLMSDKTELPQHAEERQALQLEQRKLKAMLNAQAEEVRQLEQENASLSDALRQANAQLSEMRGRGFWRRLAWLLAGKD